MKKRMYRLLALGLAALLVFGGCGKVDEPVVEETPEIVETVEEETEPEVLPEEEPEKETVPLSIHTVKNSKSNYLEEANLYLEYTDVTVEGDGYDKLKRNVENWSLERSEGLRGLYAQFEEAKKEEAAEGLEVNYAFSLYQSVTIARADSAVVSLLDDTYQYEGGAHELSYRSGINFDSQTGKRLELSDILSAEENFKEEAKERLIYELRGKYAEGLSEDHVQTVENLWTEEGWDPEWYLDASGIVIVFQEYEVGPYVMGRPEVHLPYADFEPYIKDAYLPAATDGVASFKANQEVFLTFSDSVEEVPMMLVSEMQEEEMHNSLWLGQNELPLGQYVVLEDSYIVRADGEVYCMIETDMASDDYVTSVYWLLEDAMLKIAEIDASIDAGNINSEGILMESWVYLLGTYGGLKTYHFDENEVAGRNNVLVTEDEEYILHRNEFVLTTTVELPVMLEEEESTLPAGSQILLTATDGETYVKFTIPETGQTGVLEVERSAEDYYNVSINGMNENDCFEFLPYAG